MGYRVIHENKFAERIYVVRRREPDELARYSLQEIQRVSENEIFR